MSEEEKDRMMGLLEENLKLVKLQGWQNVKGILLDTLKNALSKLVYYCSDSCNSREVADKVSSGHVIVTQYWKKSGLLNRYVCVVGQYINEFFLKDFGIEISQPFEQQNLK